MWLLMKNNQNKYFDHAFFANFVIVYMKMIIKGPQSDRFDIFSTHRDFDIIWWAVIFLISYWNLRLKFLLIHEKTSKTYEVMVTIIVKSS